MNLVKNCPRINVLHIISSLPLGGAENQLLTLVPALNNDYFRVHVCCLRGEGILAGKLRARGINVFSLNMRLRYWPVAIFKLCRLIKQLNAQIVHTHLFEAGLLGRVAAKIVGVPVIITTEHNMGLWKKRHHVLLERLVNRFTNKMIAVSEDIRQRRIHNEGIPPEKIVTIPNAVDIERFNRINSREQTRNDLNIDTSFYVIGTIARLDPDKRIDHLLEAASIICKIFPQARFLIIGDGLLRNKLEDQALNLELLPKYVKFLGSRQDIPELLTALDIFVLSSEREGLPVSLLEAMAASKPIVATAVGGIPEVIHNGVNGLMVPPCEPKYLADAIISLIENNTLRESVTSNGFRSVKTKYSLDVVSQQIFTLYDSLLKKKGFFRTK